MKTSIGETARKIRKIIDRPDAFKNADPEKVRRARIIAEQVLKGMESLIAESGAK